MFLDKVKIILIKRLLKRSIIHKATLFHPKSHTDQINN